MAVSQFLLRWNDHLSNYGDIFLSLREEEEFIDCTFACEDGLVGAHKVVLAGCSPYLRDLFSRISSPQPVICLPNTPRSLVLLLMEFIYRGQVHIPHSRLQHLVMLGRSLRIKGLTQIMVPIPGISEKSSPVPTNNNNNNNKISETPVPVSVTDTLTPMAFPHGLPLTALGSLAFPPTASTTTNNDVSILRCEDGNNENAEQNECPKLRLEDEDMEEEEEGEGGGGGGGEDEVRSSGEDEVRSSGEDEGGSDTSLNRSPSVDDNTEDENCEPAPKKKGNTKRKRSEELKSGPKKKEQKNSGKSEKSVKSVKSGKSVKSVKSVKKRPSAGDNHKLPNCAPCRYSTMKEKCYIAAYSKTNGVLKTKKYVMDHYGVKIRTDTITKFRKLYDVHQNIKEKSKKKIDLMNKKKKISG